jgi:integrase
MNRAIDAYLAELEALRFSHSRRHHAARTLERLLIYMREAHSITDWRAVNESQLRDFTRYAATRHRSPTGQRISAATLRQWLALIRSFFIWLNRNGYLLHNPAERLAFPHPDQSLPRVLNETELARLIETPDLQTVIGLRDRALMETLYATGIRHAEAHKLDLYDIDTAAHRLTVRLGKGQRDRLLAEISAQLEQGQEVDPTKLSGVVGRTFSRYQDKYSAQVRWNLQNPYKEGTRPTGPRDRDYNDCSMTACRIAFPQRMQGYGGLTGQEFGIQSANNMLGQTPSPRDGLRTGDVIRYGRDEKTHFVNVLFTDDDGTTQTFSRTGVQGPFESLRVNDPSIVHSYGRITGQYRPPF